MFTKLVKEFPRAFVLSLSIFLVLLLVRYLIGDVIVLGNSFWIYFGYTMLYGLSLYYANAAVFIYLDSVYKDNRFTINRLIVVLIESSKVNY